VHIVIDVLLNDYNVFLNVTFLCFRLFKNFNFDFFG